ncbi:cytochrome P450 3A29 [Aplysia californica]|uniref:Cytochrome P450 3A29 n=1 Tax=Aplysia californica TaxID=6500 RepID=A0ABM0JHD0_APLCA|nr:cytochrome P450 3A29 [Aplysia californica]
MVALAALIDVPVWLVLLIIAAVLYYLYATPFGVWSGLGIPGPKPTFAVGNVPQLYDTVKGVRCVIDSWVQQYGRTFGVYYFRKPLLVVTDLELLKQVFVKDFNHFTDRWFHGEGKLQQPMIKKGLFFEFGMDWKRIRRIMTPTFSSGKLKSLVHHMNNTGRNLGESMATYAGDGKLADANTVFGAFALDVICGTAFGLEVNSQNNYEIPIIKHAKSLMTFEKDVQVLFTLAGLFPFLVPILHKLEIGLFKRKDVNFFKRTISALIAERKAAPTPDDYADFLQLLLNAEADSSVEDLGGSKKLTIDEITAQGVLFIIAGYGTTSSTLQFLFYEIGRRPDIREKVMNELNEHIAEMAEPTYEDCQKLKYIEALINETLRCYPPVHLLSRNVDSEVKIGSFTIPSNGGVLIPIANIMKDPEHFPDPDNFMPERFLNDDKQAANIISFLPFGFGPRQCIGLRLAMLELKMAVVHMLKHVEVVDSEPEKLDLEDYLGVLVPKEPIKLKMKLK